MILTDKDIRDRCILSGRDDAFGPLITNFSDGNLGAISYDLSIDSVLISADSEKTGYELAPGCYIYVKMWETLNMPRDLIGRIEEKNSRMRMGLVVSGPTYQPGHKTAIFLRVHNISSDIIQIRKGMKIAQIVFEEINDSLDKSYAERVNATFQNEFDYTGYNNYENEYKKDIQKVSDIRENLEDKEMQIYGNILTFMGILMGIFSIVTLNLEAFAKTTITVPYIIAMNLTIVFAIELLMGVILIFINKNLTKKKIVLCISLIIVTLIMLIGVVCFAYKV